MQRLNEHLVFMGQMPVSIKIRTTNKSVKHKLDHQQFLNGLASCLDPSKSMASANAQVISSIKESSIRSRGDAMIVADVTDPRFVLVPSVFSLYSVDMWVSAPIDTHQADSWLRHGRLRIQHGLKVYPMASVMTQIPAKSISGSEEDKQDKNECTNMCFKKVLDVYMNMDQQAWGGVLRHAARVSPPMALINTKQSYSGIVIVSAFGPNGRECDSMTESTVVYCNSTMVNTSDAPGETPPPKGSSLAGLSMSDDSKTVINTDSTFNSLFETMSKFPKDTRFFTFQSWFQTAIESDLMMTTFGAHLHPILIPSYIAAWSTTISIDLMCRYVFGFACTSKQPPVQISLAQALAQCFQSVFPNGPCTTSV